MTYHGANFQFFDLKENYFWGLNLEELKLPFGLLNKKKRIPNSNIFDYVSFIKILFVKKNQTVGQIVSKKNNLYSSFWEPFTMGVLNTECKDASAFLLKKVLLQTFFKGPNYSGIYQPRKSWDETLIKPATKFLLEKNVNLNFNDGLKEIIICDNKVTELIFKDNKKKINGDDIVVFAIPPSNVSKFLPNLNLPSEYNPIVNIHFKYETKKLKLKHKIYGMLYSKAQWVFVKDGYFSVTISAANSFLSNSKEQLANEIWNEISQLFSLSKIKCPKYKIIIEKKATYNQTPQNHELVKNIKYIPKNLKIVGDWTQFNFPSTIESSIISAKKICGELIKS